MKTLFATFFAAICCMVAQGEDFARWVDPFVGTVGDGNCFPGPCRPFGMVQPSPDTGEKTHCGGYKFTDATIRHFSQTHLNGTGRPAMGDIGIIKATNHMNDCVNFSDICKELVSKTLTL